MAKKRKTRKQKLTSDLRSQVHHVSSVNEQQFTYTPSAHISQSTPNTVILTQDYQYVTKDLLKTAIVTGVIVAFELILFFSTKGLSG
ncbi:MAG: hypothetical protein HYT11_03415 [Candidatus Levybacteria bacterium]|nr:hypothetical protein [Candidatus Levybacteria bacterium]